jgi:hypothetical protein
VQHYEPPVLTPEQIAANMTVPPPPKPTCLSAALFDEAVTVQQTALWHETGISVRNVLFTTDDEDEEFLHELEFVFGWRRVKEDISLRIRREWGDWSVTSPLSHAARMLTRGLRLQVPNSDRQRPPLDGQGFCRDAALYDVDPLCPSRRGLE